jgi:hypothetical protein
VTRVCKIVERIVLVRRCNDGHILPQFCNNSSIDFLSYVIFDSSSGVSVEFVHVHFLLNFVQANDSLGYHICDVIWFELLGPLGLLFLSFLPLQRVSNGALWRNNRNSKDTMRNHIQPTSRPQLSVTNTVHVGLTIFLI